MKAGRWTVAGSLIVIGLALLLNQWTETNLLLELLPWWPVLLIALGAEIMFFHRRKEGPLKLDTVGIFLVALIIVVGGVIAGVKGSRAMDFSFEDDGLFDLAFADYGEGHPLEPVTIPVDKQNTLTVENDSGRIHVTPHDGKDIVIEPTLFLSENDKDEAERLKDEIDFIVDKSERQVSVEVKTVENGRFRFGFQKWRPIQLNVKVPSTFSVDIKSDNGEIKVDDMQGKVHADTDNGKIEVNNLGGDAVLKTDNGLIKAVQVNGAVDAQSANGLIHIDNVGGDTRAETDNGKIFMQSPQLAGDWEVKTSLGEIEVAFPDSSDAAIEAVTDVGNIASDFPLNRTDDEVVGGNRTGIIGEGTYDVRLETSAGSIQINKLIAE